MKFAIPRKASIGTREWMHKFVPATAGAKEVDHGTWVQAKRVEVPAGRVALAARAPGSLYSCSTLIPMSNFTLTYSISKRTPASPKALSEILAAQSAMNRVCTWTYERLALAAPREPGRAAFGFPLRRFGLPSDPSPSSFDGFGATLPVNAGDAFAQGSTRVRDNIWNAHLVAAFLRHVSRLHPTLLFELRDEGGFVVPGSVLIKGGTVEVNREFLNRERARALEVTGDPQAAVPFVWAELQGLGGTFFLDAPVGEYGETQEVQALDASWDQLESLSLEEIASLVVEHAIKQAVPAMAMA